MGSLRNHLNTTARKMLRAIAQARQISIPWQGSKADIIQSLAEALTDAEAMAACLAHLSPAEATLLAEFRLHGGRLAQRHLVGRYGEVRLYRPWQPDFPARPWEQPVSPLERLFYWGLVFFEPELGDWVIPDEFLPHLPTPDHPTPAAPRAATGPAPVDICCHDIAALVGLLAHEAVPAQHGRWLAPRKLAEWGAMCIQPPRKPTARSELQTDRRRFLHYLAEAAGWIPAGGDYLLPTPAAWHWLATEAPARYQQLWDAWASPDPDRWRAFRLPGSDWLTDPGALLALLHPALLTLDPSDPPRFAAHLIQHQPQLPGFVPHTLVDPVGLLTDTITALLAGPLTWLGLLDADQHLTLHGQAWLRAESLPPPTITPARFTITVKSPPDPFAGQLTFTCDALPDPLDWATALELGATYSDGSYHLTLTPESVIRALHRGWTAPALRDALDRLAVRSLTGLEMDLLRAWATAADRMTLRYAAILEVTDPDILTRLAAAARGRTLIHRTLSPRAVIVDPARQTQLIRRLTTQERHPPRIETLPDTSPTESSFTAAEIAQLWFLVQLYRDLGQHLRLIARIPQALVDKLTALASPADLAAARTLVDDTMATLHHLIEGRTPFPPWPADHVPVEAGLFIIKGALAEGQNLELHYYAASTDTITHRVVEPYRLNWHGDTPYLVGFCHHAQAERTFRLDRIRRLDVVPRET